MAASRAPQEFLSVLAFQLDSVREALLHAIRDRTLRDRLESAERDLLSLELFDAGAVQRAAPGMTDLLDRDLPQAVQPVVRIEDRCLEGFAVNVQGEVTAGPGPLRASLYFSLPAGGVEEARQRSVEAFGVSADPARPFVPLLAELYAEFVSWAIPAVPALLATRLAERCRRAERITLVPGEYEALESERRRSLSPSRGRPTPPIVPSRRTTERPEGEGQKDLAGEILERHRVFVSALTLHVLEELGFETSGYVPVGVEPTQVYFLKGMGAGIFRKLAVWHESSFWDPAVSEFARCCQHLAVAKVPFGPQPRSSTVSL